MNRLLNGVAALLAAILIAGCASASASAPLATTSLSPASASARLSPSAAVPMVTEEQSARLTPSPTPLPPFPLQPCQQPVCTFTIGFPLQRPIPPGANQTVEQSYRFGSTQNGKREVHHGVEFINKAGVPVLAAAEGEVVFAGSDEKEAFATKRDFYGKVVILRHQLPPYPLPIYTVYGHLLTIETHSGQTVRAGQKIGEVGLGGVAAGTHLHFEVRYGQNEYNAVRNPELWFPPLLPDAGLLAGQFLDPQGKPLVLENFVILPLNQSQDPTAKRYLATYQEAQMLGLPPWREGFAVNDLPAGKYFLTYIYTHPVQLEFEILPGQVTFLTISAQ
ncbi:MAG: M23 family metallopeptidase [Chloroflexota bacterium]